MKFIFAALVLCSLGGFTCRSRGPMNNFSASRGARRRSAAATLKFTSSSPCGPGRTTAFTPASDYENEFEYGFTDKLQSGFSLVSHYFNNHDVDGLPNRDNHRFGGFKASPKHRLLSPFKDPIGLAVRLEGGYLLNYEVDGLNRTSATSSRRSTCKKTSSTTD